MLIIFPCYLCPVLNVIVLILPIVTVQISVHTPSTAIKVKLSFLQWSFSLPCPFLWFTFIVTVTSIILIISGLCGHHLGGEAKPGQDPDCLHVVGWHHGGAQPWSVVTIMRGTSHITSLSGPRMTTDTNKVSSGCQHSDQDRDRGCEMLISERSEARLVTFRHPRLIIPVMIY